jgi:hypothetical protein
VILFSAISAFSAVNRFFVADECFLLFVSFVVKLILELRPKGALCTLPGSRQVPPQPNEHGK